MNLVLKTIAFTSILSTNLVFAQAPQPAKPAAPPAAPAAAPAKPGAPAPADCIAAIEKDNVAFGKALEANVKSGKIDAKEKAGLEKTHAELTAAVKAAQADKKVTPEECKALGEKVAAQHKQFAAAMAPNAPGAAPAKPGAAPAAPAGAPAAPPAPAKKP